MPLGNNDMRSPYGGEIHRGYIQSWNFTIERKLPLDLVVSGRLRRNADNAPVCGSGYQRRLPEFRTTLAVRTRPSSAEPPHTNMWDGYLSANYHSLQTTINKQFSKGLMIKGAYT